jgi:gluconolactonase
VADGFSFPEGPAWDGKDNIYISNCYGSWISRYKAGEVDTFVSKNSDTTRFDKSNGLTFDKDGNIFACDYGLGAILKITPDGEIFTFLSGYKGHKFNRPNDLTFDLKGNLYFTDPKSYNAENRDGGIYGYFRDRQELKPVYEGLAFPNGIAFSPDAKFLYVCESALQRILKFPVNEDGSLGNFEVFTQLPGGDPDGIAFDIKGNLYVAHFGTGFIFVLSSDGAIKRKIEMPGKKPTNVEFAGKKLRTLYITEVETNALYKMEVDLPGLKLFSSPNNN